MRWQSYFLSKNSFKAVFDLISRLLTSYGLLRVYGLIEKQDLFRIICDSFQDFVTRKISLPSGSFSQYKKKIKVSGALKNNINYVRALENVFGYFIIGLIISFLVVGIVVLIESLLYPEYFEGLSFLLLIFFSSSMLLILIFKNYFEDIKTPE